MRPHHTPRLRNGTAANFIRAGALKQVAQSLAANQRRKQHPEAAQPAHHRDDHHGHQAPAVDHDASLEIVGERTRAQRDAERRQSAVDVDAASTVKQEGASAASASTLSDPPSVAGLAELLDECNLRERHADALEWFAEQGLATIAQLQELQWEEKLIEALHPKPGQAALLRKRLGTWAATSDEHQGAASKRTVTHATASIGTAEGSSSGKRARR